MADAEVLLYGLEVSFYTQRARIALEEKGIKYREYKMNLAMAETISPWYMRLNPLGRVPTLVHGDNVVPESEKIIEYLDEIFPETPRMCPDKSTDEGHRCEYFKKLCDKVDPIVLTMGGTTVFPEISGSENYWWMWSPNNIRYCRKAFREVIPEKCEEFAQSSPDLKEVYAKKAAWGRGWTLEPNKDELQTMLHLADDVFSKLEIELSRKTENASSDRPQWLCGENFTIADIYWAVLLHRMEELGLAKRYWENDKRPHVEKYFDQIRNWDSYKKSKPSVSRFLVILEAIKPKLPWVLAIGVTAAVIGFGVGYALSKGKQGMTVKDFVPFKIEKDQIWVWRYGKQ